RSSAASGGGTNCTRWTSRGGTLDLQASRAGVAPQDARTSSGHAWERIARPGDRARVRAAGPRGREGEIFSSDSRRNGGKNLAPGTATVLPGRARGAVQRDQACAREVGRNNDREQRRGLARLGRRRRLRSQRQPGRGHWPGGCARAARVDGRQVDVGIPCGRYGGRRRNPGVRVMEGHERIRVLLADDHRILREALRMVLAAECEVVAEASDGEQAVALAAQLKPHVVVMDIGMPGIGGLSAAYRIAKEAPACKVLMLSQFDDEEYVLEALGDAGAAGYVVKTDAAAELLSAMRAVHSGRRYLSPTIAPIVLARLRNSPKNSSRAANPTRRERDVLKLIGEGATTKEVAQRLGISVKTAQAHRDNLKQKLELRSTAAMVRYAIKHKLIRLD